MSSLQYIFWALHYIDLFLPIVVFFPGEVDQRFEGIDRNSSIAWGLKDEQLIIAGLKQHGDMVIVGISEYALNLWHHRSILKEDDVESVPYLPELLNAHSLDLKPQGVKTVGGIEFIADHEFLNLFFLGDLDVVELNGFDKGVHFLALGKFEFEGEGVVLAGGWKDELVGPDLLDGALDLGHFDVVLDFALADNFDNFIFDLAFAVILILVFQDNLSIENILAFRAHHAHLANQVVGNIFELRHLWFVDNFGTMIFLLQLHLATDHGLDAELFGVLNFKVLIAAFWDVEFAVEVVDIVLVDVGRVDDFYGLFW